MIGQNAEISIVGDDDQSIYSFRFAHPEGIRVWLDNQPEPKDNIELETCWRCGSKILFIANSLIRYNPNRLRGDLMPC